MQSTLSSKRRWHTQLTRTIAKDIEIVINQTDQVKAFDLLRSLGCQPSLPSEESRRLDDFQEWRELALNHQYLDRRRLRICVPIYELPRTGDEIHDFSLPFIIVYSAELVGLPPVPPLAQITSAPPGAQDETIHQGYVFVNSLPHFIPGPSESLSCLVVPEFQRLIQSEMHVLLQHADDPPIWGQHMAQLSELIHSHSCANGIDSLGELVQPRFLRFAQWVQSDLRGHSDRESLQSIRDEYRETRGDKGRVVEAGYSKGPLVRGVAYLFSFFDKIFSLVRVFFGMGIRSQA